MAAALLAAAALLHVAVVRSHLEAGFVDPLLFTATAWAQLVVAAWVLARPGRLAWLAALAVTVPPAVAWAVSRTVGLPWGHTAGAAEDIRVIGSLTTSLEVLAALLAVVALVGARAAAPLTRPAGGVPAVLLTALIVGGTSTAVLAAPLGHQHGGAEAGHAEGGQAEGGGHAEGEGHAAEAGSHAEGTAHADEPSGSPAPEATAATAETGSAPAGTGPPPSPSPSSDHPHPPGTEHSQ